jgi:hypothetical protein
LEVGEPLVIQACVGVLSVAQRGGVGRLVQVGSRAWPKMKPANSKSLFVRVPRGF